MLKSPLLWGLITIKQHLCTMVFFCAVGGLPQTQCGAPPTVTICGVFFGSVRKNTAHWIIVNIWYSTAVFSAVCEKPPQPTAQGFGAQERGNRQARHKYNTSLLHCTDNIKRGRPFRRKAKTTNGDNGRVGTDIATERVFAVYYCNLSVIINRAIASDCDRFCERGCP